MNKILILQPDTGRELAPDVGNAIGLLMADHRQAEALFADFADSKERTVEQKYDLAKAVCGELLIHMAIEETYFYPAVHGKIADGELINDAHAEHGSAKDLIIQLGRIRPDDPQFEEKMMFLWQRVSHHMDEEEKILFPQVMATDLDLIELGETLQFAKRDMRMSLGLQAE